jgi:hypothetical protein
MLGHVVVQASTELLDVVFGGGSHSRSIPQPFLR